MTLYAGLDVAMRETAICVVDEVGSVVWGGKVPTRVEAIADALASKAPELGRVGMETGPVAVWLWHGLRDVGVAVDCIHARRAAAALKLQTNKTDRNDARGLAQLVRSGWYEPVAVKSIATYRVRAILVAREQIVGMCTALINKVRDLWRHRRVWKGCAFLSSPLAIACPQAPLRPNRQRSTSNSR